MLRSRFIPCLLIRNGGLEKTVRFRSGKYIGDPINAVRIFNEKEVDELILLDIDATVKGVDPDYSLIERVASECRMPLCYGGGIKSYDQALKIIGLGVEKVCLSSAALTDLNLVKQISASVGSQSVLVCLDVKRPVFGDLKVVVHNGTKAVAKSFDDILAAVNNSGAGEIIVQSLDRDGTLKGYDTSLIRRVRKQTNLPITMLGGAASRQEMLSTATEFGPIGLAAGSLFVFQGKYKAVLVNYLSHEEKIVAQS